MRRRFELLVALALLSVVVPAKSVVFINEVVLNPPGSLDDFREYIELQGTPGKKLDGYAIAFLNGTEEKYYPLSMSIPPLPVPIPEIDEFFSLDGLLLGDNGLLVIAIADSEFYPELLVDTTFHSPWVDLWNGELDVPGKLQNDGSNTILLIRHRPGATQKEPSHVDGLRWAKGLFHDFELITPVVDPQDGQRKHQFGDGSLDYAQTSGLGAPTSDLTGRSTPKLNSDDLEVVDEVSYEHGRGWEYDLDRRRADEGSLHAGLPGRRVHALDDPQGFNPDALTRVDYRVSGIGWPSAPGGAGQLPSGRNWMDTATEQWIRGETLAFFGEDGTEIFYDNAANLSPDAIQPYLTNVPSWLADRIGSDYDFTTDSYPLWAGRLNPLAVPYIPGDVDRDGDCDEQDISKIAAVFGTEDWIFSNSFATAHEGNQGDPATQTRPWDVDATGENGIEPSDLQWALNFQGSANGRIVGVHYESTTPGSAGVFLNPASNVRCTMTTSIGSRGSRDLEDLVVGSTVVIVVQAQITAGAITQPNAQLNGIMQFAHDIALDTAGVVRVEGVHLLSGYLWTRHSLLTSEGSNGDRGVKLVHGYSTAFGLGLTNSVSLYEITLRVIGLGSTQLMIRPADTPAFSASTPHGLKIGHTSHNGDPQSVAYPMSLRLTATTVPDLLGNCDEDPVISLVDFRCLFECIRTPTELPSEKCERFDFDEDNDVDLQDIGAFQRAFGVP